MRRTIRPSQRSAYDSGFNQAIAFALVFACGVIIGALPLILYVLR